MTKKRTEPEEKGPSVKKVYDLKENGKNATGAPSLYKPEYCQDMIQFFNREPFEDKMTVKGVQRLANRLPTFANFAFLNSLTEATLLNWCKEYPEFFEAYNTCKQLQKDFLTANGLEGLYPPASFIFVAKNITDMRDKQEVEHSGNVSLNFDERFSKV